MASVGGPHAPHAGGARSLSPQCAFWHHRWNESRHRWRHEQWHVTNDEPELAGRRTVVVADEHDVEQRPRRGGSSTTTTRPRSMLNFIHVPKAAGHVVELALRNAWHGARVCDTNCSATDTGDGAHFRGGHHSINSRVSDAAGLNKQDFVTVLREPLSRQLSAYNDFISYLSISNHSCNDIRGHPKVTPSYCGSGYRFVCLPGTGWNTIARKHYRFNGSSPCVPSVNFTEWVQPCSTQRQNAHLCSMPNVQLRYVMPTPLNLSWTDEAIEQQLYGLIRLNYLVVGTTSRPDSVALFLQRLDWAVPTPYGITMPTLRPHGDNARAVDTRAAATSSVEPPRAFTPFLLESLSTEQHVRVQEALQASERYDYALYRAALRVEKEQQLCMRVLLTHSHSVTVSQVNS